MKKAISFVLVLMLITGAAAGAFADNGAVTAPQALEAGLLADTAADTADAAADNTVDKQMNWLAKLKDKYADFVKELRKLRIESRRNWAAIKTLNVKIKAAWARLKHQLRQMDKQKAAELLSEIREKIAPYRAETASAHEQIRILRNETKQALIRLKEAVAAGNDEAIRAALKDLIALRQKLIAQQVIIIKAKGNILGILRSYLPTTTDTAL